MVKASKLVEWVKGKVGIGYVYGTFVQKCTVDLLKQLEPRYGSLFDPGYYHLKGDYTKGRCAKWMGKEVTDCSGLIKAARKALSGTWRDVSAQGTYDQCSARGTIDTMPLIPGCAVFIYSKEKKRMGHVGVYIGNGEVVEARDTQNGVVITKMKNRAWEYWGLLDWVDYDLPAETGKAKTGTESDAGEGTGPKPEDKLPYEMALKQLFDKAAKKGKATLSYDYWSTRKEIDRWFAELIIKLNESFD